MKVTITKKAELAGEEVDVLLAILSGSSHNSLLSLGVSEEELPIADRMFKDLREIIPAD